MNKHKHIKELTELPINEELRSWYMNARRGNFKEWTLCENTRTKELMIQIEMKKLLSKEWFELQKNKHNSSLLSVLVEAAISIGFEQGLVYAEFDKERSK